MITKDDCLRFNCKIAPYTLSQQTINLDKASLKNKTALSLAVPKFKCSALYCTDIKTQELCDNTGECVWNNNGACELFSGCGSYQVDKKEDCLLKSTQTKFCTYDEEQQSNGKYNCINDLSKSGGSFMTCFSLNNENLCNQYEYAVCTWRTFQQCQDESDEVNLCYTSLILLFFISPIHLLQQYQYCIGEESKDCADLSGFQDKCDKRENYCKWIKDMLELLKFLFHQYVCSQIFFKSVIIVHVWRRNVLIMQQKLIARVFQQMIQNEQSLVQSRLYNLSVHGKQNSVYRGSI